MRILMKVGYYNVLFAANDNTGALIQALDGAAIVEKKGGYGEPNKYVPEGTNIEITIVPEDSLELPENDNSMFENYHKCAAERDEAKKKVKELEKKIKEINDAVGTKEE